MKYKNIFVLTDTDLDGAMSVLILKWMYPDAKITHKAVNERNFDTVIAAQTNLDKYDRVFICDLNILEPFKPAIDKPFITIIDHHIESVDCIKNYKQAEVIALATTSCALLMFQHYSKTLLASLTDAQKLLIVHVNDYDCFRLNLPNTLNLNTIFFNYREDKVATFCEQFATGMRAFNEQELNIIRFHNLKLDDIKENCEKFFTILNFSGTTYNIVAAFASYAINEVAEYMLTTYKADIVFVVNTKTQSVSVRRSRNCLCHLGKFAKALFNGAGTERAAAGPLNDRFITLTKIFDPL